MLALHHQDDIPHCLVKGPEQKPSLSTVAGLDGEVDSINDQAIKHVIFWKTQENGSSFFGGTH